MQVCGTCIVNIQLLDEGDFEFGFEHILVLVVTRTQHHPVLAECDRLLIVVDRNVPDSENRHSGPATIHPDNMQFLRP
jgi:hypothetical protein